MGASFERTWLGVSAEFTSQLGPDEVNPDSGEDTLSTLAYTLLLVTRHAYPLRPLGTVAQQ